MRVVHWGACLAVYSLLSGCLLNPRDGQTYTRDEPFTVTGYTPYAGATMHLQGWVWESSTWESLYQIRASTTATTSEGDLKWYPFEETVRMPTGRHVWRKAASSGTQRRIYGDFRVYYPAGQVAMATFPTTADDCLRANPGGAAIEKCASSRSPVARIYANCGKVNQTCCHTNDYPYSQSCDAGSVCNDSAPGATFKCERAGFEGDVCLPDGTCATGNACIRGASGNRCESLQGKVTRSFAGIDNRCAESPVPSTLLDTPVYSSQTTSVDYASREETRLPPDNIAFPDLRFAADHVQSIGRIPGSANERLMVMSISNSDETKKGGLFFVDVGQVNGHDGNLFLGGNAFDKSKNRNVAFYEMNSEHPGGMQVMGKVVATVGIDHARGLPFAWFFDVSDPTRKPAAQALIQRVDLNQLGPSVDRNLSAVALTRMKSGRYLMVVSGGSTGPTRKVWFYISDQTSLTSGTTWRFHNTQEYTVAFGTENINFVTQCDGTLYLLHAGNDSTNLNENGTQNRISVHRLAQGSNGKLELRYTNATAYGFRNEGHCNFRAAGNVYVTRDGELTIYCANRGIPGEDRNFGFAEYPEPAQ